MTTTPNRSRAVRYVIFVFLFAVAVYAAGFSSKIRAENNTTDSPAQLFQARLAATDGAGGDRFGWTLAVSGNTAIVGAYTKRITNWRQGVAYIFQRTGSTWVLQATLIEDEPVMTNYGLAVAISGDTAVVGRPYSAYTLTGAFYVYQRNGTTWTRQAKFEKEGSYFGTSVAIAGDRIVVGESNASTPGVYRSGAASIYRFNGTTWEFETQLTGSQIQPFDNFGNSVGINGDTVVVGAYADDPSVGVDAGSAYIFRFNGTAWTEQTYLVPTDNMPGDYFGWRVGISGDTAVIGAKNDGSAYVYQRAGGSWTFSRKLFPPEAPSGAFGWDVAINGDTIVVGAPLHDSVGTDSGAAYYFRRYGEVWDNGTIILAENAAAGDAFGASVSVSDNGFLVGAPFGDSAPALNPGTSNVYVTRPSHRNIGDFDGDTLTDLSVYRPSDNTWYALRSSNTSTLVRMFGTTGDLPAPGDYDGDGRTDIAVFRPSIGTWFILNSSNGLLRVQNFGVATDVPTPADFDGNGLTDVAVFRPSEGTWYITVGTGNIFRSLQFGANGDRPVPGDYDGDSKSDIAVMRPSTNTWYVFQSLSGNVRSEVWGANGDVPVPGDYDGDTQRDIAVYRPSDGGWYVLLSTLKTFRGQLWGAAGDVPVPGDYNSDGKTDFAVFRPSIGTWLILQSGSNSMRAEQWGTAGDIPVPSSLNY